MSNIKDGLSDKYYKNGQLRESVFYKNGKKDGFFEQYLDDGKLKEKGNYKNGEKVDLK